MYGCNGRQFEGEHAPAAAFIIASKNAAAPTPDRGPVAYWAKVSPAGMASRC
jgi:hypothetical protein